MKTVSVKLSVRVEEKRTAAALLSTMPNVADSAGTKLHVDE